jgi:chromosome segregation ATPase
MLSKPFRADTALGSSFSLKDSLVDLKDSMDSAGQTALDMINRAAITAKESNNEALNAIQELSHQLQTASSRIKELEGQVNHYRVRAERAERWFATISAEIQRQFQDVLDKSPEQPSRQNHFRIAG